VLLSVTGLHSTLTLRVWLPIELTGLHKSAGWSVVRVQYRSLGRTGAGAARSAVKEQRSRRRGYAAEIAPCAGRGQPGRYCAGRSGRSVGAVCTKGRIKPVGGRTVIGRYPPTYPPVWVFDFFTPLLKITRFALSKLRIIIAVLTKVKERKRFESPMLRQQNHQKWWVQRADKELAG